MADSGPRAFELRVRIYSARNIPSKYEGKELFVIIEFAKDKFKTENSQAVPPSWNEECTFPIAITESYKPTLILTLCCKDIWQQKNVASLSIPAAGYTKRTEKRWYQMEKKGSPSGIDISLELLQQDLDDAQKKKLLSSIESNVPSQVTMGHQRHFSLNVKRKHNPTESQTIYTASTNDSLEDIASGNNTAPEVTGISPNSGPESGDTHIIIRGENLGKDKDDIISLTVCGIDCLSTLIYQSDKKIFCTTKPGIGVGSGVVCITTKSGGKGVSNLIFTYQAAQPKKPEPADIVDDLNDKSAKELRAEIRLLRGVLAENEKLLKEKDELIDGLEGYVDKLLVIIMAKAPEALQHSGAFKKPDVKR